MRIILALYLLTVTVRVFVVRDGNFPFWFDVGRDAIVSRQIIEQKDLKIQGPNASGTNDTVFHGVLHYYIIGPLYTLFGGDPQLVLYALILLSSTAIIPVYLLSKELTESENWSVIAGILYAFSYDAVRANTWLSNPVIDSVSIPFFFLFLWLTFFKKKQKYWSLLCLSLAISHQGAILFVTLWGVVAVAYLLAAQDKKFTKNISVRNLFTGFAVYLLGIASMILAQYKVWRVGIFNLHSLSEAAGLPTVDLSAVWGTGRLYILKITQSFFPSLPIMSILLFLILAFLIFNSKKHKEVKQFLLLFFTAPLFLLSWHYRNMFHSFLGLEALAVIAIAVALQSLPKFRYKYVLLPAAFCLFIFSNYSMLKIEREARLTPYFLPQGAYFKDQLALVDYTYSRADGKAFSISSLTNPYGYNTLWAYLYSWYGQKKYGYTPVFVGPHQEGRFGEGLLEESDIPESLHFSIWEPPEGIPEWLATEFGQEQTARAGVVAEEREFGTMRVEERVTNLAEL